MSYLSASPDCMTLPRVLDVLNGSRVDPPPVWLMRQAGRYLPEYRELRARAGDFISFCMSPDLAAEATLQPLRRFQLDASIVFADILLLPHVMGQTVSFVPGDGPRLEPLSSREELDVLEWDHAVERLAPVYETLVRVRRELADEVALIGFAGGPWTVATYMIGGGKDPLRWDARVAAWRDPEFVSDLINRLARATAYYLIAQAQAGAQVLMIFDSWTDALPPPLFEALSIAPTADIVRKVRSAGVDVPIIGFPRGSGAMASVFATQTGVNAIALDMNQASEPMMSLLPEGMPVQGALDPSLLAAGGAALAREVERIRELCADRPHIFNLGHGISPGTSPEHVSQLIDLVRS